MAATGTIINWSNEDFKEILRSVKGASFCQVTRIRQFSHDNEVITEGNQKWQGAVPNLKSKAIIRVVQAIKWGKEGYHKENLNINISAEPRACARKYFTAASVSWFICEETIKGINLIRFSSILTQINSQLDLEMTIKVDITIIIEASRL
jgi:hypothetical protein